MTEAFSIQLHRYSEEPWGFRLIGGTDFGMPLTVVKITPDTPAQEAGLHHGDTVVQINGADASTMTHDDARAVVAEGDDCLSLGVVRGLYDPILDDYEPIYDQIESETDQLDSDQPLQPTEVFQIQTFDLNDPNLTFDQNDKLDFANRSLTESPFVIPSKPYRPFSTEPIDVLVPPVEDPIILNPDFHDIFKDFGIDIDVPTKFKLPISEQYDPDGKKTKVEEKKEIVKIEVKDEIDVQKEVQTIATEIILNSIDQALTVAEEIKKEVDVEISRVTDVQSKSELVSQALESQVVQTLVANQTDTTEKRELVQSVESNGQIEKQKVVDVSKQVAKFESKEEHFIEKKQDVRQEIDEVMSAGHVKRKSGAFEKDAELTTVKTEEVHKAKTVAVSKSAESKMVTRQVEQKDKSDVQDVRKQAEVKTAHSKAVKIGEKVSKTSETSSTKTAKSSEKKTSKTGGKTTKTRGKAEHRAYAIGLQTIPNIRGTITPSGNFDLLLRTFFVHLTDVMVALSRFILTETVLTKTEPESEEEEEKSETEKEETVEVEVREEKRRSTDVCAEVVPTREEVIQIDNAEVRGTSVVVSEKHESVSKVIEDRSFEDTVIKGQQHNLNEESLVESIEEVIEKRKLCGSKMAQLTEKKSEELTHHMDAVICEFSTKVGIEETEAILDAPTAIVEKEESHITERKSVESIETKQETGESKNMYIAIVESHVYTNKDSIVNGFTEVSEKSSSEETKMSKESYRSTAVEKLAVKDAEMKEKVAKTVNEKAQEIIDIKNTQIQSSAFVHDEITEAHEANKQIETIDTKIKEAESVEAVEKMATVSVIDTRANIKKHDEIQEVATKVIEAEDLHLEIKEHKTIVEEINDLAVVEAETNESVEVSEIATMESVKSANERESEIAVEEKKQAIVEVAQSVAVKETQSVQVQEDIVESKQEVLKMEASSQIVSEAKHEYSETKGKSEIMISEKFDALLENNFEHIEETKNDITESFISETKSEEFAKMSGHVSIANLKETTQKTAILNEVITSLTNEIETSNLEIEKTLQESIQIEETKPKLKEKLHLDLSETVDANNIKTPSPTKAPTPVTDEYMFRLEIPLPKTTTIIPRDCSFDIPDLTDHEDPNIVKKKLVPHIDTPIVEEVVFDPPLPTPPGSKPTSPVYTKPGLRGGADKVSSKEEILEIERKSSLLATAIDQTIRSIEEYKTEVGINNTHSNSETMDECVPISNGVTQNGVETEKTNEDLKKENNNVTNGNGKTVEGYRPIQFHPEEIQAALSKLKVAQYAVYSKIQMPQKIENQVRKTSTGEIFGTYQGIVDGLEQALVDPDIAKELGKPGLTEEKIAELISGESEMLREAHVMGLSRVLRSHMEKDDDSSVDFKRIKPIIESLKDSEVLRALNEELIRTREEKQKEEKKWTTFLQKPERPVPKAKFGYHGYVEPAVPVEKPYRVKIVKQPKPKIAPDYKPETFETGPLPWEERALREPSPPPVEPEEPILVPEEDPEILEAVDPLPESEVPDLEDSGIPLPPPKEPTPPPTEDTEEQVEVVEVKVEPEVAEVAEVEAQEEEMDQGNLAEQLIANVQKMVDPTASLDEQLTQMRAQVAALAQLPAVLQQALDLVSRQLGQLAHVETTQTVTEESAEEVQIVEVTQNETEKESVQEITEEEVVEAAPEVSEVKQITPEELEQMRREEEEMIEEQKRLEKQKKELEEIRLDQESRQLKQRSPRVSKPKPVFGPATPQERPLVLPGGRKWRKPKDAYNEQFIAETLTAQAELIMGKAKGSSYESVLLPYDERVNFLKYEKPPVSLDHLQDSETYKLIHSQDEGPRRRVDILTPVVCEADYREKCRAMTPCTEQHKDIPQQVQL